jgi:lactate permease
VDQAQLGIPLTLLNWLLVLAPIVVLLVLLAVFHWAAPDAGALGMFTAAVISLLAFRTPWMTVAVAGAKGVWDAVFILYVVWAALILYQVTRRAGAFAALRQGIMHFSRNELFLVMAFGWVFASFLQGIAGFGAPIAVVAPLLVALRVRPVYAVVIPLIGHAWAKMFGTLAVGWLATLAVVDLENATESAFQSGILLWIPNLAAGFTIAWFYGRGRGIAHAWPLVLIISLLQGGVQLLLTLWDPVLSAFLAGTVALLALYPLSRWKRYSEPAADIEERPAMAETAQAADVEGEHAPMGLAMAALPYAVLTFVAILVLVVPPIKSALAQFEIGLPFPQVQTGYGVVREGEDPYLPFSPLTHPGTFLLVASLVGWVVYRARGYYAQYQEGLGERPKGFWSDLAEDAVPSSVSVIAFLVMSKLMDHSGQTHLLALGIREVAPPTVYAFAANWIGVLGAFMTSSSTSSNILFAPIQQTVAQLEGLTEPTIIAAQNAGGAIGNVIAPANLALGTGTAGIIGREGEVLRRALPWTIAVATLVGLATILLNGRYLV